MLSFHNTHVIHKSPMLEVFMNAMLYFHQLKEKKVNLSIELM